MSKRVIEQTLDKAVPEGSQAAEYLFHKGLCEDKNSEEFFFFLIFLSSNFFFQVLAGRR